MVHMRNLRWWKTSKSIQVGTGTCLLLLLYYGLGGDCEGLSAQGEALCGRAVHLSAVLQAIQVHLLHERTLAEAARDWAAPHFLLTPFSSC